MRRRDSLRNRRAHPEASGPANRASRLFGIRYRYLAVFCGIAAGVIAVFLSVWNPPATIHEVPAPTEAAPAPPSLSLPTSPASFAAGELRNELQTLGEQLLKRFAKLPESLHVVALLYSDLQRTQDAEKLWLQCIDLNPKHVGPYVGLARVSMELGDDKEAVDVLRRAIAAGCSSTEVYHELTAGLTKLGELADAEKVAREGLEKFPDAPENWFQVGQVQLQLEKFAEAEQSLLEAQKRGEASDAVFFSLATVCAAQGKAEEAAKYRKEFAARKKQAVAVDVPFQRQYDSQLRTIAVATCCRAASVFDRQGCPEDAERLLLRALSLDPQDAIVCGELVQFLRRSTRPADALVVQQRLVDLEPDDVRHLVNIASLAGETGDLARAEAALKRVLALRPDLPLGYLALAQLYLGTGNFSQSRWFAEATLRQQFVGPEETVQAYAVLAESCRAMGDETAAGQAFSALQQLTSSPGSP